MNKIRPYIWYNDNGEEAINFYISIFKNSKILSLHRYGDGGPFPSGTMMIASFQLEGQDFMALNGGPQFKINPAISLYVDCVDQAEVDLLYDKLSADGEQEPCGWLRDKFGLSWQIIPSNLGKYVGDSDPEKAGRAFAAMMTMKKIDIAKIEKAWLGK